MDIILPLGLRNAIESGTCVLFLGAGIGANETDRDGDPVPDGSGLGEELVQHFKITQATEPFDLAKVAQVAEYRAGRPQLDAFIKERLADLTPDEHIRWLASIPWRAIFTTNYDLAILRAYELEAAPAQRPVPISSTEELVHCDPRVEVPVYYLHGNISGPDPHIIITQDDYARFRDRRRMLFEVLKLQFAESTILYVGYSNRDPNWRMVLEELRAEFAPQPTPQAYRIVSESDPLDTEILQRKSVETIIGSLADFRRAAMVALSANLSARDTLEAYRSKIPPQLLATFEKSPAPIVRLLGRWQYVNGASFDEAPNVRDFLRGEKANWGLISRDISFQRDVESALYDDMLDYATSSPKGPTSVIALGPAGYGTTTLLMQLAARSVRDRIGNVFFLRDAQVPSEGDVEFAAGIDPTTTPIFFVDSASKYPEALRACLQRLRHLGLPALFVLGSRLNQWHGASGRPNAVEHVIEPLTDDEIGRLLDCLAKTNELGVLANLPRDLQFSAIKRKYQQELLVVLREATEGRMFDAIIVDEYRAIATEDARRAYLVVSCFYQAGIYVRDALLAELLGIALNDMYRLIAGPTEGIIRFDETDISSGAYGAKARHRTIAAIVWQNCGSAGEREKIAMVALSSLNLNYQTDVEAFWEFVQTPNFVDEFRTLDDKIRFFETACQKDPTSPYVRQHYARMFKRSDHLPLALKEIDAAIELNAGVKVLHHTRGLILGQLAMEAPTEEVGRRRLIQAEDAFKKCISLDRRDDYGYTGLAEIDLDWAEKVSSDEESNEYLARAELAVSEGLRNARVQEQLWVVSSKIERFLGNEPKRIAALEAGLGSVVASRISRYFLGRYYRSKGRPKDALNMLKPALDNFQDDYRLFIEYAQAMVEDGEPYANAAAVLRIANITGMRDARYIATLGGMLFMAGEYTESTKVFAATRERNFSFAEQIRPFFVARNPDAPRSPLKIERVVSSVKPGYAFIDAGDRPSFFHYGTKIAELVLRPGLRVQFEPAFSARGPVAKSVVKADVAPIQQSMQL